MVGGNLQKNCFLKAVCLVTVLLFSFGQAAASGKKDTAGKTSSESGTAATTNSSTETASTSTPTTSETVVPSQTSTTSTPADSTTDSASETLIVGQSVTLSKIDQLIKQTKYSEALALIAEYIKLYPDNFDAAKTRIDRIMATRHNYNAVENDLIDLAANSPSEADKNYQMVLKLEKIEQQPSVIHETIREEIKNLTQFKACQQRFNEIINAAIADVNNKQYAAAAEEFRKAENGKQSAFEVYQEDFIAQNNPRSITQPVDKALAQIDTAITEYGTVQTEVQNAYAAFVAAVKNHRYTEAQTALGTVQASFTKLAQIRNNAAEAGWQLENIFASLKKKNPDLTDASYLPFASRFIIGLEKDSRSGILGAMDTQWNELVSSMKDIVYQTSFSDSETFAKTLVPETLFTYPALHEDARNAIVSAKQFADLGTEVNGLYALIRKKDGTNVHEAYTTYDAAMKYISQLSTASQTLLDEIRGFASEQYTVLGYTVPADSITAIRTGKDVYTTALITASDIFINYGKNATSSKSAEWLKSYAPKTNVASATNGGATATTAPSAANTAAGEKTYTWDNAYLAYIDACTSIEKSAQESSKEAWIKTATVYGEAGTSIAAEYESRSSKIHELLPVVQTADSDVLQYPQQCISQLESMQKDIAADRTTLLSCSSKLEGGRLFQQYYEPQKKELDDSIQKLASLISDGNALAQRARTQLRNAQLAQNEAETRYNQAKNALAKSDFDSARTYLQQSREKYIESLLLQEDAELRKTSDTNLVALGTDITRKENEIVVRDVRKFKNDARTAYYAGNFDEAETLLTRAEARWQVTNVDTKDDELESLKALVNTALSMKTGRVIPPTAPLYPEMSQILSLSNQYYTQGQKLMQEGKKTEATSLLNQAKQKLNELKLVYPLNQEASLLSLQIDQLLDRQAFNTMFAQKVSDARVNYKSNDANAKQQAYSDLVDLYEINPNYPGLKDLIYQVEIDLGLRKKPVDTTTLKRAVTLANQAKRILDSAGRDSAKLQQAKDVALQALALNPDNDTAITVLDEVALKAGGQAAVVISAADEELYQKAVQELQKNNIIAANTIVQQLLNKPLNRRSAKILELQKKVQALL
jgi:HEPN domain-containing protein